MNLLHMKYAVEIAKVGSINRAAENLYVGQPNLSRAIKELETSLGITIFERSPKGMVPTPDGEDFLRYASKILREVDEVEAMYRTGAPKKQQFSISVPRAWYISHAFSQFSKKLGSIERGELFYKETNALRAIKNIQEADYHLGIIRYAAIYDRYFMQMVEEKGFVAEPVADFRYSLILSKHHPLAGKDKIYYRDLEPYIEIAHADPFVPSLSAATVRKEELPDINRRIFVFERASQYELLMNNRETFMWVSPSSEEILDRYDLVQKTCEDNEKIYKDILIYRKDYRLSELDRQFIAELRNATSLFIKH